MSEPDSRRFQPEMTKIRIPAGLRDYTGGRADVDVQATTVGEALESVARQHPSLRRHLYNEQGQLRSYVNVFLNDDEIRSLNGLDTTIAESDTVMIVPS